MFFRDLQEWGWTPRRLDPRRSFAAPRSLRALIGPKPKVIDSEVWAKLLWAGLNLEESDLTRHANGKHFYPVLLVKALCIVWLFSGLRADEIQRLRVGCTRENWNTQAPSPQAAAICNLDVPVNKTSHAFTKPVDQIVGESIRTWEAQRPDQPAAIDEKTGEAVKVSICLSRQAAFERLHQSHSGSYPVQEGRRSSGGRARQDHQPPRTLDHCVAAIQR